MHSISHARIVDEIRIMTVARFAMEILNFRMRERRGFY